MKVLLCLSALLLAASSDPIGSCPEENQTVDVLLPDDSDCSIFYQCDWGSPVQKSCAANLAFSTWTNTCDYPENVDCARSESNVDGGGNEGSVTDESADCDDSMGVEDPIEEGGPLLDCPSEDGQYALYIPDKADCSKYYVCRYGEAIEMSCPEGLLWNGIIWSCDYPDSVTCYVYKPIEEDEDPNTDCGTPNEETPEVDDGGLVDDGNTWAGECPDSNVYYAFGDTQDPHKFYICDNGTPVEVLCPSNLVFNQSLMVCDYA